MFDLSSNYMYVVIINVNITLECLSLKTSYVYNYIKL